jgi:N-succinyldiaminopimelate aminotransferase
MNPDLEKLHAYPFERLTALKAGVVAPDDRDHIALSIGEPRHQPPAFVVDALRTAADDLGSYPTALGQGQLRETISAWLEQRFKLPQGAVDPASQILPVNGTREGIFSLVQAVIDRSASGTPIVAMPNPFYQIYEGAALLAGAEPYYINTVKANGFLPDLDAVPETIWERCQILFLCTPGNPTGAIMDLDYLRDALALAERYHFIIAGDECYADIYLDESAPPPSLAQAALADGRDGLERCVLLHSLSKRSNVPGLRSGFVAGEKNLMARYRLYRTYHGCAVPHVVQRTSVPAWTDTAHVDSNRELYRQKFDDAARILDGVQGFALPDAAFYIWLEVDGDDEAFARDLFAEENLTTLPGRYLSRPTPSGDPGEGFVRISLVPEPAVCADAMKRLRRFIDAR